MNVELIGVCGAGREKRANVLNSLAYAEMRLILAKVLWHFDLELVEPGRDWLGEQKVFALWDKGSLGVRLKAVKR